MYATHDSGCYCHWRYLGLTGTPVTCISLLGGTMILKNFTYESEQIGKMIYNNSVSSKFFGLSVSD